jgi:hypothetical protein
MDQQVAIVANRKIPFTPSGNPIQFARIDMRPSVNGFSEHMNSFSYRTLTLGFDCGTLTAPSSFAMVLDLQVCQNGLAYPVGCRRRERRF